MIQIQKYHPHYFETARDLIAKAEKDLNRELSNGERRNLLADNTEWSSQTIRAMVNNIRPDSKQVGVSTTTLVVTHVEPGKQPETRTYDFRASAARHAYVRFASWALANGIAFKVEPMPIVISQA